MQGLWECRDYGSAEGLWECRDYGSAEIVGL